MAVVGGLSLGVGILFVFVGIRRAIDRRRDLLFGVFALAYAGWILASRAWYLATDVDDLVAAGRVTSVLAALSFSLLVLFVARYSGLRPRLLIFAIIGVFGTLGVVSLVVPDDLMLDSAVVEVVELPWGETVRVLETSDATSLPLWLLLEVAVAVYIVWASVDLARRDEARSSLALAMGGGWFIITIAIDLFVVIGPTDFVYVFPLGILGFVIVMGLDISNRAIETEAELHRSRFELQSQVAERTAHLEAAQIELVAKTAEEAALAERDRLARELHDAVTQTLFSLNLIAGTLGRQWRADPEAAARSTDEVQRLARGALSDMRVLLRELRPQAIAETDLGTLLGQLSEGLGTRYGIRTTVDSAEFNSLPEDVHLGFYRVAQEAIHNVGKHADASRLTVEVAGADDAVHLVVTDDGVGFDRSDDNGGSMGLHIMQERADAIGARLSVTSSPGAGTSVVLAWPTPERSSLA